MKKAWMVLMGAAIILAACGQGNDKSSDGGEMQKPIDAQIDIPKQADKGEKVTLAVTVTQDDKAVDDAGELEFEVWPKDKKEDSKMVEAKHDKEGLYKGETTFDQDGTYVVQAHVTARDMHTMPKEEITIGNGGDHEHHHEGSDTSIHFMAPEELNASQDEVFTVHVENDKKPLTGAEVRLEISQEGVEKHEWIDGTEKGNGEYEVKHTFPEAGEYMVKVHVTKGDEVHDHIMETVKVD